MTQTTHQTDLDAIKAIAGQKKIKHLVHFTRTENLLSILKYGILGREEQRKKGINSQRSGRMLQNAPDAISCSITIPNHPMFSCVAGRQKDEWVVIVLKADVMWTKPCVFCERNAASKEIVESNPKTRMGPEALRNMFQHSMFFKKIGRRMSREQLMRAPYETTDVQAEVLVLGPIGPDLFVECAHKANISAALKKIANSTSLPFCSRDFYFEERLV